MRMFTVILVWAVLIQSGKTVKAIYDAWAYSPPLSVRVPVVEMSGMEMTPEEFKQRHTK